MSPGEARRGRGIMKNRDYTYIALVTAYIMLPIAMGAVCLAVFGFTRGGIGLAGMSSLAAGIAAFAAYDLRNG